MRTLMAVVMVLAASMQSVAEAQFTGWTTSPPGEAEARFYAVTAYSKFQEVEAVSANATLQLPDYDHLGPIGETLDSIATDMAGTLGVAINEKVSGMSDWGSGYAAAMIGEFKPAIVCYTSAYIHWSNALRLYAQAEADRQLIVSVVSAWNSLGTSPVTPIPLAPILPTPMPTLSP